MKIPRRSGGTLFALAVAGALSAVSCRKTRADGEQAASSAAVPAAPLVKTVRFEARPARVGDKARVTRNTRMKMSVEYWQDGEKFGSQESLRSEEFSRDVEVLALVGGVSAEERAHYDRYRFKEAKPDQPPREDNSLEGQTYIVDARERDTKATFANGKPVAPEELERLERVHADLGLEDKIVAELKDKAIAVGAHSAMREELFHALVPTASGDFKGGTITLSGRRMEAGRDAAVFDWSAEMTTEEETGMETTWHIKGHAVIAAAPALTLKATMTADIDVGGHTRRDGKRIDMEGSGSMQDERTFTPL